MNTTITFCRCCNEPMDSMIQPRMLPHQSDITLIHCINPDCTMRYQTVAERTYHELNLAIYHATEYVVEEADVEICDNCNRVIEDESRHWIRVGADHWRCESEPRYDGD